jgi:hypothetical protein
LLTPSDVFDLGERPIGTPAWIFSPAILLINSDGVFEFSPDIGQTYRVLVIIRNSGNAPVMGAVAEFLLGEPPLEPPDLPYGSGGEYGPRYTQTPVAISQRIGQSAFSVESRGFGWALSPPWSVRAGDGDTSACLVARIFDPVHDMSPMSLASWAERKVAFRALEQDLAGTWSGTEVDNRGQTAQISFELMPDWSIGVIPGGVSIPKWRLKMLQCAALFDRPLQNGTTRIGYMRRGATFVFGLPFQQAGPTIEFWRFHCGRYDGSTAYMTTHRTGIEMSSAVMPRVAPGPPPPPVDVSLLRQISRVPSPAWSKQRRDDARLVFHALSAAGA